MGIRSLLVLHLLVLLSPKSSALPNTLLIQIMSSCRLDALALSTTQLAWCAKWATAYSSPSQDSLFASPSARIWVLSLIRTVCCPMKAGRLTSTACGARSQNAPRPSSSTTRQILAVLASLLSISKKYWLSQKNSKFQLSQTKSIMACHTILSVLLFPSELQPALFQSFALAPYPKSTASQAGVAAGLSSITTVATSTMSSQGWACTQWSSFIQVQLCSSHFLRSWERYPTVISRVWSKSWLRLPKPPSIASPPLEV